MPFLAERARAMHTYRMRRAGLGALAVVAVMAACTQKNASFNPSERDASVQGRDLRLRADAVVADRGLVVDGPALADAAPMDTATDAPSADLLSLDSRLHDSGQCERPPGGCFSPADCPAGHSCDGCEPDPCCPACTVCYGRCVPPPTPCSSNEACESSSYCAFDQGNCGSSLGKCTQRPEACDDVFEPVCGCDGRTYSNACDAAQHGRSVLHFGACSIVQSCGQLQQAYLLALERALVCCPNCGPAEQCTRRVPTRLGCSCEVFVNRFSDATQDLDRLIEAWDNAECRFSACPPCVDAKGGVCAGLGAADPSTGRCLTLTED